MSVVDLIFHFTGFIGHMCNFSTRDKFQGATQVENTAYN